MKVDPGTVLRPDVVPLPVGRRRVDTLEEQTQKPLEGGLFGVVVDLDGLCVSRAAVAYFLISRGRVFALGIPDRGLGDSRFTLVGELETPEAASCESRDFESGRSRVGGELAGVGSGRRGGGRLFGRFWSGRSRREREVESESEREQGKRGELKATQVMSRAREEQHGSSSSVRLAGVKVVTKILSLSLNTQPLHPAEKKKASHSPAEREPQRRRPERASKTARGLLSGASVECRGDDGERDRGLPSRRHRRRRLLPL